MTGYRLAAPELAVLESHVTEPYDLSLGTIKKFEDSQIQCKPFDKPSKYTGVFAIFPLETDHEPDLVPIRTSPTKKAKAKAKSTGEGMGWGSDDGDGVADDDNAGETGEAMMSGALQQNGWDDSTADGDGEPPADQAEDPTNENVEGPRAPDGDGELKQGEEGEEEMQGGQGDEGEEEQPDHGEDTKTKPRNPDDRFTGVTFLHTVDSPYKPADAETFCAIGRMPRSRADRSQEKEKEPKEDLSVFASQHDRESYIVRKNDEREARERRDKAWAALSEEMRAKAEEKGEVATFSLRPMLAEMHDYRPHFECVFTFAWKEGEEKKSSQMYLYLWPNNTGNFWSSKMETTVPEMLQHLETARVLPGEGAQCFTAYYDPRIRDAVWSCNILGDGDFGPWQGHVDQLRRFVVNGGVIRCALANASGLPDEVAMLQSQFADARKVTPLGHFWTGKYRIQNYGPKELAPRSEKNARPMKPRIAYPELLEKITFELAGRARDNEWAQQLARISRRELSARFVTVPGHPNLLWMFVVEPQDRPLEIQPGDKVKVRIHTLNPADIDDDNWKGVAEPTDSLFGATYRRFTIRRPMDKETDEWLGEDPSLLNPKDGRLPGLGECADRQQAAELLDHQKPRAVDIRLDDEGKSFHRAQTTVRAALEQAKREKAADPRGRSVTQDLLQACRFDRLPAVDLLDELNDQEFAALLGEVGGQQADVLRGLRRMRGGVALVQGCAGAGKTHVVLTVIRALVKSRAARHRQSGHPPVVGQSGGQPKAVAAPDPAQTPGQSIGPEKDAQREEEEGPSRAAEGAAAQGQDADEGGAEKAAPDRDAGDKAHEAAASGKGDDTTSYRTGLKAVVATPINTNAEHLADVLRQEIAKVVDDPLVMRKYSKETNRKLFTKVVDDERYSDLRRKTAFDYSRALRSMEDAHASAAAKASLREFRDRNERYFGADKRVTEEGYKHSAAAYVAYALDLMSAPDDVSRAAVQRLRHAVPRDLANQLRDAVHSYDESEEEKPGGADVSARFEPVLEIAFNVADCIVVSLQHAMDPGLYLYFKPAYFFIDEAAKCDSADSMAWIWYPSCVKRVLVGDTMQSRPQMRSPPHITCFNPQLTLSYLAQAQIAGKETRYQVEQHRYGGDILDFISQTFYGGRLTLAPSAAPQLEPELDRFRRFARKQYRVSSNVIMVNVRVEAEDEDFDRHSEQRGARGSRYNPCTSVQAARTVDKLKEFGYEEKDLGIITLYEAGRNVHESLAASRQQAIDPTSTSQIMFETAERAQGLQRKVLIFEVPNTDSMGFINTATRLNTGLTRVSVGLIIIFRGDALASACNDSIRGPLGSIINYCKRKKIYIAQQAVAADHPVWGCLPDFTREAPTTVPDDIQKPTEAADLGEGEGGTPDEMKDGDAQGEEEEGGESEGADDVALPIDPDPDATTSDEEEEEEEEEEDEDEGADQNEAEKEEEEEEEEEEEG